jgi:hypothetical protein
MHLQISCLGIMEDLTDVVDRSSYSPDSPGEGVGPVDRSPLAQELGLQTPRTRGHLRGLGPSGLLAVGTQSGHLRELLPDLGFGAQGGLWELGPGILLITWPFCRIRVLGPISDYRSSLQRLRLLWFQPLYDQHHTHDFNCSRDVKQQRLTGFQSYHDWQ